MVPAYASAAALLYVACVMTRGLAEIDWEDITEYAPAVVTAVTMPLTYSIATGIGLGFITYALAKIIAGKFAEAKPAVVILALLSASRWGGGGGGEKERGTIQATPGGALAAACWSSHGARLNRRQPSSQHWSDNMPKLPDTVRSPSLPRSASPTRSAAAWWRASRV